MKKKFKLSFRNLLIIAVLVIVGVAIPEYLSYNYDIASCPSDNLWEIKNALETFAETHDGNIPKSLDEFREW